ncbi:hypothetical protein TVAG_377860 [Trichomonas vaginalis G3]|uniref:Uncharacterized protein n=1 Tax=Trichomonas vaginalis (strain ATCC PRA-98 / G3) TaxID=412133 RepID=A2DAX7_TRIV3|nr:hypothetical protein TVAGG3_0517760 [Trichomonas vaginalis G3]EAY22307.1 hypothetical protein TVAG_377860 [Trichomonas vaginalis G3]KAI5518245.1 hypothetical protein TVAGG3_0517760 [Trichomonas vaginalis G3]|eukprot:XP_001583293.1 hypothetical protein [Trichomonas vaginalis G3]
MDDLRKDKNMIYTPSRSEPASRRISRSESMNSTSSIKISINDNPESANRTETIIIPAQSSAKTSRNQKSQWRDTYFPNYPLRKKKSVQMQYSGSKSSREISLSQKILASLNDTELLTDSTEIESDLNINGPLPPRMDTGIQTDWKVTNNKLRLEVTFEGETLLKKDRKFTLVTLPHDYIEIGFRADANKNDEFANIVHKKFDKNRVVTGAKKKKEESQESQPNTSRAILSTTEIFPFASERKIKYLNYNANTEKLKSLQKSNKKSISSESSDQKAPPEPKQDTKETTNKKILLIPVLESDLEEMDVTIPMNNEKPKYMNPKPPLSISEPYKISK